MHRAPPRRQRGAALLAFLLLFVVGATFALLRSLNATTGEQQKQQQTMDVLVEAKQALIAYAVTYPDLRPTAFGPGHLPCPDLVNDGNNPPSCSLGGNTSLGRLPWRALGTGDLRDASGERLWYALSDAFRYFPSNNWVNSDSRGQLIVDGMDDIVAVIIAPGPPLAGQEANRITAPNVAANFLEGVNAVANDPNFTARQSAAMNDTVVYITRAELMDQVENRVLTEVHQAFKRYAATGCGGAPCNAWPWLSTYASPTGNPKDPVARLYNTVVGEREGHLPLHFPAEVSGSGELPATREVFPAAFDAFWSIGGGSLSAAPAGDSGIIGLPPLPAGLAPIPDACVRARGCLDDSYWDVLGPGVPLPIDMPFFDGKCVWRGVVETDVWVGKAEYLDCSAKRDLGFFEPMMAGYVRWYRFVSAGSAATPGPFLPMTVQAPTATSPRKRRFFLDVSAPATLPQGRIIVVDTDPSGTPIKGRALSIAGGSGFIDIVGIPYDLDVDAGELPRWFRDAGWHRFVYVAYGHSNALPGINASCATDGPCLTLNTPNGTLSDVQAVAMIAGPALTDPPVSQDRVTAPVALADFFEQENDQGTTPNTVLDYLPRGITFNDKLRVLLPLAP